MAALKISIVYLGAIEGMKYFLGISLFKIVKWFLDGII